MTAISLYSKKPVTTVIAVTKLRKEVELLLANGVPLKHIQEWLGHSDFTTTANIYAHLDYSSKITSAQAMETGLALPESGDFTSRWGDNKSAQKTD